MYTRALSRRSVPENLIPPAHSRCSVHRAVILRLSSGRGRHTLGPAGKDGTAYVPSRQELWALRKAGPSWPGTLSLCLLFVTPPPSLLLHYPQQSKPGKRFPRCSPGIGFQQVPGTPYMSSKRSCQLPHTQVTRVEKCFPKGKLRGSYQKGE